jgi:hypothetical protein
MHRKLSFSFCTRCPIRGLDAYSPVHAWCPELSPWDCTVSSMAKNAHHYPALGHFILPVPESRNHICFPSLAPSRVLNLCANMPRGSSLLAYGRKLLLLLMESNCIASSLLHFMTSGEIDVLGIRNGGASSKLYSIYLKYSGTKV